jgi:putative transposase
MAAFDQDGDVLDILVQSKRDKKAAKKFFRKLLKGLRDVPLVIITDKLKSYNAAKAEVLPKSSGHVQRFLSVFGIIASHFGVGRHRYRARCYRKVMKLRFALWDAAICV